jgi:hypothetical protein
MKFLLNSLVGSVTRSLTFFLKTLGELNSLLPKLALEALGTGHAIGFYFHTIDDKPSSFSWLYRYVRG